MHRVLLLDEVLRIILDHIDHDSNPRHRPAFKTFYRLATVCRAWKDPAYRNSLTEAERAVLPPNPAGSIELSDADLGKVAGGFLTIYHCQVTVHISCDCSTNWPRGYLC